MPMPSKSSFFSTRLPDKALFLTEVAFGGGVTLGEHMKTEYVLAVEAVTVAVAFMA